MFSRVRMSRGRFLGIVITIISLAAAIVTILQFWDPRTDPEREEADLRAKISALDIPDEYAAGEAALGYLNLMHRRGYDMTGLTFPRMILLMASFEGVNWSSNTMNRIEFGCTDQVYDQNRRWNKGTARQKPCAQLKGAQFVGSRLKAAYFNFADLFDADFTDAVLEEVKFEDSSVTKSRFLGGVELDGIQIDSSDFSQTRFRERATFRCTAKRCPKLRRSDFSPASIPGARFTNATLDQVDLAGTDLQRARFNCDKSTARDKPCSTIEQLCLRKTILTDAVFEGITISNTDFSEAILGGAKFVNVHFENVVFPDHQVAVADLKEGSLASLNREGGRVDSIRWESLKETPCTDAWRDWLKGQRKAVAFEN